MKKTRYYPFERNRYFYGKLLTVRDFESEQKYFNDKRRMMNRLLHGSGVLTGLQVVAVDEKSVSVEMGAAIDALGREIVVPSPMTLKLSMMDGFSNNEYAKNVYLCIAYDEKEKEPVHAVANSSVRSDEINDYNRVLESYRLFIREDAPEPSKLPLANLTDQTIVLYQDAHVRVLQTTPRYVNPGQLFEMKLRFEKTLRVGRISFQYELAADRVEAIDGNSILFEEPQDVQESEYEMSVLLRADSTVGVKATVGVQTSTAALKLDDKQLELQAQSVGEIQIIGDAVRERLMTDFVKQSLEASLEAPSEPCIYLAKICLIQVGPTYVIESVEQVPFGEYVYNSSVMYRLARTSEYRDEASGQFVTKSKVKTLAPGQPPEFKVNFNKAISELSFDLGIPAGGGSGIAGIVSGVVDIPVEPFTKIAVSPFGKATKSFFSGEIAHGLGEGNVLIITSLEESSEDAFSDILSSGERVYGGASDVFKGTEFEPDAPEVKIGTIAYPQKGTFRIGVKVQQTSEPSNVRVRWWAYSAEMATAVSASAGSDSLDEALSAMREAASAGSETE
ncbi:hypothetical protein HZF08_32345 [Paenibacillus sp. CGMCC 1.16610]|uniref:Uncharacterized protein n=1 Tax=Paenibacillus anseongense TaxID=2682845 RepID=A0ABW9U039_9BACL|nr:MULTISPECIES: hypothetical protein [Paenibacillus]MBA2942957.1 hypothetical protein [Paenibacillus sp. CGMCC 1.16610]MVQ33454.1 hypothetical protein [Paenibacillus anseongense]